MGTHADTGRRAEARESRRAPAYGPVSAALGFGLFYVLVARATPTVVSAFAGAVRACRRRSSGWRWRSGSSSR